MSRYRDRYIGVDLSDDKVYEKYSQVSPILDMEIEYCEHTLTLMLISIEPLVIRLNTSHNWLYTPHLKDDKYSLGYRGSNNGYMHKLGNSVWEDTIMRIAEELIATYCIRTEVLGDI